MRAVVTPAQAGAQHENIVALRQLFVWVWVPAFAGMTLFTGACSASKLAYGDVKSAMVDAGLNESDAGCMAERMTDSLSLGQLQKLKQFKGEKRSLFDYVAAVRRIGDTEAVEVTATSAALCTAGLARERR